MSVLSNEEESAHIVRKGLLALYEGSHSLLDSVMVGRDVGNYLAN